MVFLIDLTNRNSQGNVNIGEYPQEAGSIAPVYRSGEMLPIQLRIKQFHMTLTAEWNLTSAFEYEILTAKGLWVYTNQFSDLLCETAC